MAEISIAVIGGGASAVLLLAHLATRPNAGFIHIDLYDRTDRFAKGVAYSTKHDCHLLNVRAANMSAFHEDKDHFAVWAAKHGYQPLNFVPRKIYGRYLSERLEDAEKSLEINRIKQDVLSSVESGKKFTLTTPNGVKKYDKVILASGNVRPLRPFIENDVKGYYDDPWAADFHGLLTAKKIALIGSGLSAVDMVLALDAKSYEGKVTIFSRNALLPEPHVDPVSISPFLTDESASPLEMLRAIRDEVVKQHAKGIPWQAVIDALRSHTNPVWQNWNEAQKKQFSKRLMTFWNIHRHRMAPQIAGRVAQLQKNGSLDLVKSGVRSISQGPIVNSAAGPMEFDAVVNCLGYRYDEEGRSYDVSGRIGPPNFGELFETTAIPEIRAQAHALALKILP